MSASELATPPNIGDDLVARLTKAKERAGWCADAFVGHEDNDGYFYADCAAEAMEDAEAIGDAIDHFATQAAENTRLRADFADRDGICKVQTEVIAELEDEVTRLRAELAEREAAISEAIGALEADDLDQQICCHGHECGCQGATHRQLVLHNLRRSKGAGE